MRFGLRDYEEAASERNEAEGAIIQREMAAGVSLPLVAVNYCRLRNRWEFHFHCHDCLDDFLEVFPEAKRERHDDSDDKYMCQVKDAVIFTLFSVVKPPMTEACTAE